MTENQRAELRVVAGIAGILKAYANRTENGEPVSAKTLRRQADRLMDSVRAILQDDQDNSDD